jgi:hypothetical protein
MSRFRFVYYTVSVVAGVFGAYTMLTGHTADSRVFGGVVVAACVLLWFAARDIGS